MKAVVFDLDDTLYPELDFVRGGFAAAAAHVERRNGIDAGHVAERLMELLHAEGRGRIFDRFLDEAGLDAASATTMLYLYRTHHPTLTPYPDVAPVLRTLADAGLRLGVLTDGLASVQRRKLEALNLSVPFDVVVLVGELPSDATKPASTPYQIAAELLGLSPEEITYVGNDPYKDFAGARALGMRTIRVRAPSDTFPRAADAREDDADRYVDPFEDIVGVLLND